MKSYQERILNFAKALDSDDYNTTKLAIDVFIRDIMMTGLGYAAYTGILSAGGPDIAAGFIAAHVPAVYDLLIHPAIEKKIIANHMYDPENAPLNPQINTQEGSQKSYCAFFGNHIKEGVTRLLPTMFSSFSAGILPTMLHAPEWVNRVVIVHTAAFFSTAMGRRDSEQGVTPETTKRNILRH